MKFYLRCPDPLNSELIDNFINWFPANGQQGTDWWLAPDKNKLGGRLCATFMNEEMASLFVLMYSNWIIPEPADVHPEENSYSYSEEGFDPNEPIC